MVGLIETYIGKAVDNFLKAADNVHTYLARFLLGKDYYVKLPRTKLTWFAILVHSKKNLTFRSKLQLNKAFFVYLLTVYFSFGPVFLVTKRTWSCG